MSSAPAWSGIIFQSSIVSIDKRDTEGIKCDIQVVDNDLNR